MAIVLFTNNAASTLAAPITNSATTVSLSPGTGALFPSPTGSQYFPLSLWDAATGTINEIVYCTARSTDTLTIVRAREGTTGRAWLAGDNAYNFVTASTLEYFAQYSNIQTQDLIYAADTGTANSYIGLYTPAITALNNGMVLFLKIAHTNSGASTLTVNGLSSVTIYGSDNAPLTGGELIINSIAQFQYNSAGPYFILVANPSGLAKVSSLAAAGSVTVGTTLNVGGASALTGNTSVGGTLAVTGTISGAVATTAGQTPIVNQIAFTNCYFQFTNSTTCTLIPYNGNYLTISGAPVAIPSGGVTLSTSGLSTSTFYYVYAFLSGSTLTLLASTTGYTVSTTYGIPVKSDSAAHTLVGAVYTNGSTQFTQTAATALGVMSYYNRRRVPYQRASNTATTTSLTSVELSSANFRISFISWLTSPYIGTCVGLASKDTSGTTAVTGVAFNSGTGNLVTVTSANTANYQSPIGVVASGSVSTEAQLNYITVTGSVSANTGTYIVISGIILEQ